MSAANDYKPHLLVIPEDKANQDIVNGFSLHLEVNERQFTVLPIAKGWSKGKERLSELCEKRLSKCKTAYALLIVDYDGDRDRGSKIKSSLPAEVKDRVFVIGILSEPERLKSSINQKYEDIGRLVAEGCREKSTDFWEQQELLAHNLDEVQRLSKAVRNFFFKD
jgi:hypothetical protein